MSYSHTTWSSLQSALSQRLQDSAQVSWVAAEVPLYLTEALRTFGVLSAFWRSRGTIPVTATTAFYDIPSLFAPAAIVDYTVTDQDLIQEIQYMLNESAASQTVWGGTSMFTMADIVNAIQRRRNQFLSDTGIVLTHSTQVVASPPIGRQVLTDTIIDVRRCSWVGASPFAYYTTMWREDERVMTYADTQWSNTSGTPMSYSVMAPPPLQLQLNPPPMSSGTLDMITVNTGADLTAGGAATILGIPDDLTPAVKWGALADLLGMDGEARDPSRAAFCEKRYQQFVQLARMLPLVVHAELNGVPTIPVTLDDLDMGAADWQNQSGAPSYLALAGWSMAALDPIPDSQGPYSLTLDVVQKAPIPTSGIAPIQVGREQLDMILDYAEHLALFKVGGAEFAATARQADNFLTQCITYNQRLGAAARYVIAPKEQSQRQKFTHPRRQQADGLGAASSVQDQATFVPGNAPVKLRQAK